MKTSRTESHTVMFRSFLLRSFKNSLRLDVDHRNSAAVRTLVLLASGSAGVWFCQPASGSAGVWFCWRLLASGSASQRLVLRLSSSCGAQWKVSEMSIWKCDDFIKDLSWTCLKGAVCKKSWFLSLSPDTSDTSDASDTLDCTFKTYIKHCTFTTCVFLMMSFSPVVTLN